MGRSCLYSVVVSSDHRSDSQSKIYLVYPRTNQLFASGWCSFSSSTWAPPPLYCLDRSQRSQCFLSLNMSSSWGNPAVSWLFPNFIVSNSTSLLLSKLLKTMLQKIFRSPCSQNDLEHLISSIYIREGNLAAHYYFGHTCLETSFPNFLQKINASLRKFLFDLAIHWD